jgi:hypothetical protein
MTLPDRIERAQQRCRAEIILGAARVKRRRWLLDLAAAHNIPAPVLEVDNELAVHAFALELQAKGIEVDALALNIPTADQYLAGARITPPPPTERRNQ